MTFNLGDLIGTLKLDASSFVEGLRLAQSQAASSTERMKADISLGPAYAAMAKGLRDVGLSHEQLEKAQRSYMDQGMTAGRALLAVYMDISNQMKGMTGQVTPTAAAAPTKQAAAEAARQQKAAMDEMYRRAEDASKADASRLSKRVEDERAAAEYISLVDRMAASSRKKAQDDVAAAHKKTTDQVKEDEKGRAEYVALMEGMIVQSTKKAQSDIVQAHTNKASMVAAAERKVLADKQAQIAALVAPDAVALSRSHQLMSNTISQMAQQFNISWAQAAKAVKDGTASARADMTALLYDAERLRRASTALFQIGAGVTAAGGAVLAGVVMTGKAFADFDQQMQNSISIMESVSSDMEDKLAAEAKRVAVEVNTSANDIAKAMRVMASAGYDSGEILSGIGDAAKYAKISTDDLGTSVRNIAQIQTALGKERVTLTQITNALISADRLAVGGASQFAEGLNKLSGALRYMKKDLTEGLAMIMTYHQVNVQGAAAGTQAWMALRDTERSAKKHGDTVLEVAGRQKKWHDIVFDSNGVMRNFALILRDLEGAMKGLSPEQIGKALTDLLGYPDRSRRAMQTLLGLSQLMLNFEDGLKRMGGSVDEVLGKKMNTFNEQLGQVKQRLTNLAIEMGEPTVRNAQLLGRALDIPLTKVEQLTKAMKEAPMAHQQMVSGMITLGGAAASAAGSMILWTAVMTQLAGNLLQLRMLGGSASGVFRAMTVAFTGSTTQAVAGMSTMKVAILGLETAILGLGARLSIILAVAGAFYELHKAGQRLVDLASMTGGVSRAITQMKSSVDLLPTSMRNFAVLVGETLPGAFTVLKAHLSSIDWESAFKGMLGPIYMLDGLIDRLEILSGLYPDMKKALLDRTEKLQQEAATGDKVAQGLIRESTERFKAKQAIDEQNKSAKAFLSAMRELGEEGGAGITGAGPGRSEMLQRLGVDDIKKAIGEAQAAFSAYSKTLTGPQLQTAIETLEGLLRKAAQAGIITSRQFREQINGLEIKGLAAIRDQFTDAQWGEAIDFWAGELHRAVTAGDMSNAEFHRQAKELDKIADMRSTGITKSTKDWFAPLGINLRETRKELQDLNKILDDESNFWGGLAGMVDQETDSLRKLNPWLTASVGSFREMSSELSQLVIVMGMASGMTLEGMRAEITKTEEAFRRLGITSSQSIRDSTRGAQEALDRVAKSVGSTSTDLLNANAAWYREMIKYWEDMAAQTTGAEKQGYEEKAAAGRNWLRDHENLMGRVVDSHRVGTQIMTGFWREWKRQVSTIITDLSRDIMDALLPKAKSNQDAAGITELGLRAGVTGKQLEDLVAKVKQLALATGQDFSSIASAGADVFQKWGLAAEQQIPTLEAFWAVVQQSKIKVDDLMQYLVDSADLFRGMGLSVTEAAAMIGQLAAKGLDVPKVLDAMDAALKKISEQGFNNPTGQLARLIERIKQAGSEAEATALAVRYFSNDGAMMARIIRDGTLEFDRLTLSVGEAQEGLEVAAERAKDMQKEAGFLKDLLIDMGRAFGRAAIEAVLFSDTTKKAIGAVLKELGSLLDFIPLVGEGLKKLGGIITGSAKGASDAADAASKAGGAAGDVAGAAGGAAGAAGSIAGAGISGMLSMFTGFAQLGVGIASLIGQRAAGMDSQRTEENTRFCKGYLLELVNRSENWDYIKWTHQYMWDVQKPMLFQMNDNLTAINTSLTGYNPAVSTPASYPAYPVENLQSNMTVNLYYNDKSIASDADVQDIAQRVARHVTERGVRARRGTR
jgi:TP901 family phage tail tape measure protein